MRSLELLFARFDAAEFRLCRYLNRRGTRPRVLSLFRTASRLGDGMVWYALMAMLPIFYDWHGLKVAAAMLGIGAIGLVLYRVLKKVCVRERPFVRHTGIDLLAAPLDRYSFPSGHTLHATCFTWVASSHFPELAWGLVPLAAMIAMSRVVLGLHYPTDVLVGGLLGAGLGAVGAAVV
jgi:undecaprenyl-diphosphatase